jgi:hypothetical protein
VPVYRVWRPDNVKAAQLDTTTPPTASQIEAATSREAAELWCRNQDFAQSTYPASRLICVSGGDLVGTNWYTVYCRHQPVYESVQWPGDFMKPA